MGAEVTILNGVRGSVRINDGTAETALFVAVDVDVADWTVGPLPKVLNEPQKIERRGSLLGIAPGSRIFPEGSFTCHHVNEFSHATKKTVQAMVLGLAPFAARVSTSNADYPTFDILFQYDDGNGGQKILCEDCYIIPDSFADGDETGQWSFSFEVWGKISINDVVACAELAHWDDAA